MGLKNDPAPLAGLSKRGVIRAAAAPQQQDFTNGYGEACTATLEYSGDTAEWVVRTSRRSLSRCGGLVTVTTTETVESYSSHRQAARGANWCLYLLAAGQEVSHFDY